MIFLSLSFLRGPSDHPSLISWGIPEEFFGGRMEEGSFWGTVIVDSFGSGRSVEGFISSLGTIFKFCEVPVLSGRVSYLFSLSTGDG